MRNGRGRALVALVASLGLAAPGLAARGPSAPGPGTPGGTGLGETAAAADTLERDGAVLLDRSRELLHRGRPLDLIGHEQAGNSFRAASPGLAQAKVTGMVSAEENHARRLAMYGSGESYRVPLAPATATGRSTRGYRRGALRDAGPEAAARPSGASPSPDSGLGSMVWAGLLSALVTGATCLVLRGERPWGRAATRGA